MRNNTLIKVLPLVFTMQLSWGQTAAELLEQGVQFQTTEGNLDAAIKEYKAVLKASSQSKRLAAEARYRLAECFQEKGNQARMNDHLKALREEFPSDNKWVVKSLALSALETEFSGKPWKDGRIFLSKAKLPGGKEIGEFILAQRKIKDAPDEVWESIAIRSIGGRSISRTKFSADGYRSLGCRWYMEQMGDVTANYREDGEVVVIDTESKEEKGRYNHAESGKSNLPFFENEVMVQVLRTLNLEIGTKQETIILAALAGASAIPFNLEVTEHVDIETAAGSFSCAKIETNLNQTFYVSREEGREIVRMDMGGVKVNLAKVEEWDVNGTKEYSSENFPFSYSVPGTMIQSSEKDEEKTYKARYWASDFAGRDAVLELKPKDKLDPSVMESSKAYAEHIFNKVKEKGIFDEFNVVVDSWEELEVDGKKFAAAKVHGREGELDTYEYLVTYAEPSAPCALMFYINYAKVDEERALERAREIAKSMKFGTE